jgi:hypothetical protein
MAKAQRAMPKPDEYRTIQAGPLMSALSFTSMTHCYFGNYAAANALLDELLALADEKGAPQWKAMGIVGQGYVLALTGKASDAIEMLTAAITAIRSTGATLSMPSHLSILATAYAGVGQFDDAWRCIGEAKAAKITTYSVDAGCLPARCTPMSGFDATGGSFTGTRVP